MGIFEINFIEVQKMFWQSSYGVKKLIPSSVLVPSTVPQCCWFSKRSLIRICYFMGFSFSIGSCFMVPGTETMLEVSTIFFQ